MSEAAAQDFITRVEHDEAFAVELDAIKADPEAVLARVRAEGYDATHIEIRDAVLEHYGAELSPEQLDAIAAGLAPVEVAGVIGGSVVVVTAAAIVAAAAS